MDDIQPEDGGVIKVPTARTAVVMEPEMGSLMYPITDELGRSGAYEPGVRYRIPEDLSFEKAEALVDHGPFRWI
ncbi:hypothetical protein D3C86_1946550 [compost metagenome]